MEGGRWSTGIGFNYKTMKNKKNSVINFVFDEVKDKSKISDRML